MSGPLLWDVDTQVDFIRPDGKLPVPEAEEAVPAMARLVRWAEAEGVTHLATADDHELTDPEIADDPDFQTTFPPHCLRSSPGFGSAERSRPSASSSRRCLQRPTGSVFSSPRTVQCSALRRCILASCWSFSLRGRSTP